MRMGKGKGAVHTWVHRLEAGKILFELNQKADEEVVKLLNKVGKKLPTPSITISRRTPGPKK
jgi:ribosomal protein L16/L10AE